MKSIGQIISPYRKEAGLSQIALSKKLKDLGVEVSSKSISASEHGRSEPSVETFRYVCRIL
jgi:transcriptional regulator with XRE-family HTH domain